MTKYVLLGLVVGRVVACVVGGLVVEVVVAGVVGELVAGWSSVEIQQKWLNTSYSYI